MRDMRYILALIQIYTSGIGLCIYRFPWGYIPACPSIYTLYMCLLFAYVYNIFEVVVYANFMQLFVHLSSKCTLKLLVIVPYHFFNHIKQMLAIHHNMNLLKINYSDLFC